MYFSKNVLMTTTSSIAGHEIEQYLGLVSSKLVIGTGLFTDIFSGFTDFFGAKSGSYQNKLKRIENEALKELEKEAANLNANGVIGLRLDFDEISGAGKSMMMLTALGTAVKLSKPKGSSRDVAKDVGYITRESMELELKRAELLAKAKENPIIDDQSIDFIINNELEEFAPVLLKSVDNGVFTKKEKIIEYFSVIPEDIAIDALYTHLKDNRYSLVFIKDILAENKLVDYEKLHEFLIRLDKEVKMAVLDLLRIHKPIYKKSDLSQINDLMESIENQFPRKAEHISKKGMLSKKEQEYWVCTCGKHNEIAKKICYSCSKDEYGFTAQQTSPKVAIEHLKNIAEVIKGYF